MARINVITTPRPEVEIKTTRETAEILRSILHVALQDRPSLEDGDIGLIYRALTRELQSSECPYGRTHWNGQLCSACTDS